MTPEELRRHALKTGAELDLGGTRFNTARAQVSSVPRALAAQPPVQVDPAPQTFSRSEVEKMLAEQEARFQEKLTSLLATMQTGAARRRDGLVPVGFTPNYKPDGSIAFVGVEYRKISPPAGESGTTQA